MKGCTLHAISVVVTGETPPSLLNEKRSGLDIQFSEGYQRRWPWSTFAPTDIKTHQFSWLSTEGKLVYTSLTWRTVTPILNNDLLNVIYLCRLFFLTMSGPNLNLSYELWWCLLVHKRSQIEEKGDAIAVSSTKLLVQLISLLGD